jgi:hypothetical protein
MKLVSDVQGGEDRNFAGIDSEGAGGDFAHALINVFGELF